MNKSFVWRFNGTIKNWNEFIDMTAYPPTTTTTTWILFQQLTDTSGSCETARLLTQILTSTTLSRKFKGALDLVFIFLRTTSFNVSSSENMKPWFLWRSAVLYFRYTFVVAPRCVRASRMRVWKSISTAENSSLGLWAGRSGLEAFTTSLAAKVGRYLNSWNKLSPH